MDRSGPAASKALTAVKDAWHESMVAAPKSEWANHKKLMRADCKVPLKNLKLAIQGFPLNAGLSWTGACQPQVSTWNLPGFARRSAGFFVDLSGKRHADR